MVTVIKKGTDRINIQNALESVSVRKGMLLNVAKKLS